MFMTKAKLTHKCFTVEVLPIQVFRSSIQQNGDDCCAGLMLQWQASEQQPKTILLSKQAKCASLTTALLPACMLDHLFSSSSQRCCNTKKANFSELEKKTSASCLDAYDAPSADSMCTEASFLVVTDIGELMLLRLTCGKANLLTLGRTETAVTWIGVLAEATEQGPAICVVHSTGSAMLLNPATASRPPLPHSCRTSPSFLWSFFDLDRYIVCCCGAGSSLVTSDGHSVTVSNVNWKRRDRQREIGSDAEEQDRRRLGGSCCDNAQCDGCGEDVVVVESSVDIFGVVDVTYNNDLLILKTVDGRKYQYTWEQFKKKARTRNETNKNDNRENEQCDKNIVVPGIEEVMKGIEKCSYLRSEVRGKSKVVDCYLEQLNLGQHLHELFETKNKSTGIPFDQMKLNYRVKPTTHPQHVFDLVVSLACSIPGLEFNNRWWSMRVSVPSETGFKHVSVQLKEKLPDNVVVIGMTKREANRLFVVGAEDSINRLELRCDFILNDFANLEPIISTEVAREKLSIFRFLSCHQQASQELNPSMTFEQVLYSMHDMAFDDDTVSSQVIQRITLGFPFCERFVSQFIALTHFSSLGSLNSSNDDLAKKQTVVSGEKRLWFLDTSVSFKVMTTTDTITIGICSAYVPLAVAVKRELVKCFSEASEPLARLSSDKVLISQQTIRALHVTQRLVDASLDDASSLLQAGVVRNLYEHLTSLIHAFSCGRV